MIRSVNYCFQNKIIATFYCEDGNKQNLFVGYIEKFNDDEILFAHISPHGFYDGFILKHIDDVRRIDYDGEYEKKIERLYKLRQQVHKAISTFDPNDDEILYSLLDFAKQNDYIATLELADNNISGLVNGYSNDMIYLDVINDYGEENGISIVNVNEILSVAVDTDHEQDLRLLAVGRRDGLREP